jgi:gas vesicle protein
MTDAQWWLNVIVASLGAVFMAWATWISRAVNGSLSRKEHRELCEDREKRVSCDLEEIKELIKTNHDDASNGRSQLTQRVQSIAEDVAILKARKVRADDSQWLR